MPARVYRKRKVQSTARRFLGRTGGTPTTTWGSISGRYSFSTAAQNAEWRYVRQIAISGDTQILRMGGLKLTLRADTPAGTQVKSSCIGIIKVPGQQSPSSGTAISLPGRIRQIFGKETVIDTPSHATILVQRTIKGMLTLNAGESLWLVMLVDQIASSGLHFVNYVAEWSQRLTDIRSG